MKELSIRLSAEPQNGRIEIDFTREDEATAVTFMNDYIHRYAEEYCDELDEDIPPEIMAAALAFTMASRVLHFVPGAGVQWLIDSSAYENECTVREYARDELGMLEPASGPQTA
jgi:hypothetical protein